MEELGIAVLKIRDILLVTISAEPDDRTISSLQKKVLEIMEEVQAKGLIIDISTVEILDSFFARTLLETAQMISLMGGLTVIAGMRPDVAITATQLGLTMESVICALDVDRAVEILERRHVKFGTNNER